MIVRRIREHVSQHNWFAVGIDLAIVIVGVFIGTQANNWNEARIERAAAADYREQIIDDLKSNEADIAGRLAYYRSVRVHALATLAAIETPSRPLSEQFLIDAYQASQVWLRPLIRTGYDEMTGAGLSHGIGDRQTRSKLTAWYTQIPQFDATASNMTSYRERLRRAMPYKVQYAVRKRCGERVTTVPSGAQMAALPHSCSLDLDQSTVGEANSWIEAADLGEDLTRHIADIDQKLAAFERFGRLAREIRVFLEAQERG